MRSKPLILVIEALLADFERRYVSLTAGFYTNSAKHFTRNAKFVDHDWSEIVHA